MSSLPARDTALTKRMVATLGAVLVVDALAIAVLALLVRPWLAPVAGAAGDALGVSAPPALAWLALGVPALAAFVWVQLRYTRRETLDAVDAEVVGPRERPDLHARVTRLAAQADVQVPTVAVADSETPNSFAVGSPRRSTVVVSTGLLDALDDAQLDAVLAHELAHVKNHDAAVMTLASFLPAVARGEYSLLDAITPRGVSQSVTFTAIAVLFGAGALAAAATGAPGGSLVGAAVLTGFVVLFGGVMLGLAAAPVVYLSERLAHDREFAADRAGALAVGSPAALASALRTLDSADSPAEDARTLTVDGLCLLPHGFGGVATATHPSTADRIDRLKALATAIEGR
ncbi:M48 family metalloprotease [Halomarina salina]|uniref:M48 family metalloprotease n=1 Tax=Halomarina salina TaxID=1872699 RepID=A0ABD5RK72_9EURY|nr:M48 family metalloprotease [Halomarina salina]